MKITRSLISAASALAMFAGSVAPAFANQYTPPTATVSLRRQLDARDIFADAFSSLTNMQRMIASPDMTGRSMLARSQVRYAQRNLRRHILGYLRGVDYRILNVAGDARIRSNLNTGVAADLPTSLVQTGGSSSDQHGDWMYDRPTRRDISTNNTVGCVFSESRDILNEIENGVGSC